MAEGKRLAGLRHTEEESSTSDTRDFVIFKCSHQRRRRRGLVIRGRAGEEDRKPRALARYLEGQLISDGVSPSESFWRNHSCLGFPVLSCTKNKTLGKSSSNGTTDKNEASLKL